MSSENDASRREKPGKEADHLFDPPRINNFAAHLRWHLKNGTNPKGRPGVPCDEWHQDKFLAEIERNRVRRSGRSRVGLADGSARANLNNWLSGNHRCQDVSWANAIDKTLFGDNRAYDGWRMRLRDARLADPQLPETENVGRAESSHIRSYASSIFREILWDDPFPRQHPYDPTQQEYREGLVVRPHIIGEVVQRLRDKRWAVVLGRGASGKTVLGNLLSLDSSLAPRRSFYLNVARYQNSRPSDFAEVTAAILSSADPADLFLVDNIHLDEDLAHDVLRGWWVTKSRYLVFLGRQLGKREGSRFANASAEPTILLAREHEVRGVFHRLALRRLAKLGATERTPPRVPDNVVAQWMQEFGGRPNSPNTTVDLMMLSFAIQRSIDRLFDGDWPLSVVDAKDEVRTKYLNVTENERRNLFRLSALPEDFQLPGIALFDPYLGFPRSVEGGIVFEIEGPLKPLSYRFAHAALGRMMAQAYEGPQTLNEERRAIASRDPKTAYRVSRLFLQFRKFEEAGGILETLCRSKGWVKHFDGHLGDLLYTMDVLIRQKIADDKNLVEHFADDPVSVARLVKDSPLNAAIGFLRFIVERKLFGLSRVFLNEFPNQLVGLRKKIWLAPIGTIPTFFNLLEANGEMESLEVVKRMIIEELQENPDKLIEKSLDSETPFDQLAAFFSFLDRSELRPVRAALARPIRESAVFWPD